MNLIFLEGLGVATKRHPYVNLKWRLAATPNLAEPSMRQRAELNEPEGEWSLAHRAEPLFSYS